MSRVAGFKLSEETKRKISEANKGKNRSGRVWSEESKRKLSETTKGRPGRIWSDESKQKMSIAHTGKILTEEHKRNISESNMGREVTEETKQKISEANTCRTSSEETKRKISKANKIRFCKYGHDTSKVFRPRRSGRGCVFCACIRNAKERGIVFDITEDQCAEVVNSACIFKCTECNTTGIDRIDSSKGYIPDNIQPMCGNHNYMKRQFLMGKFTLLCTAVHEKGIIQATPLPVVVTKSETSVPRPASNFDILL